MNDIPESLQHFLKGETMPDNAVTLAQIADKALNIMLTVLAVALVIAVVFTLTFGIIGAALFPGRRSKSSTKSFWKTLPTIWNGRATSLNKRRNWRSTAEFSGSKGNARFQTTKWYNTSQTSPETRLSEALVGLQEAHPRLPI